jgi:hypothetical protein
MDRETRGVLRLVYMADGVPDGFPVRESRVTVDYREAEIAGSSYLLPVNASVAMRQGLRTSRNEVTFQDYRKFSADSSILFDAGAGPQR